MSQLANNELKNHGNTRLYLYTNANPNSITYTVTYSECTSSVFYQK